MDSTQISTANDFINQGKFKKAKKNLINCIDKNYPFLLSKCYNQKKSHRIFVMPWHALKN